MNIIKDNSQRRKFKLVVILISISLIFLLLSFYIFFAIGKIKTTNNRKVHFEKLIDNLQSPDVRKRREAANESFFYADYTDEIGPHLLKLLNDSDVSVRHDSMITLGNLRYEPETCIPLIIPYLTDSNPKIRKAALISLAEYEAVSDLVFEKLLNLVGDPEKYLRLLSLAQLTFIDRARENKFEKQLIPIYIEALKDTYHLVRREAAYGLKSYGESSKNAIPDLVELLTDEDEVVRERSAMAIKSTGPHLKEATTLIEEKLKTEKDKKKREQLKKAMNLLNEGE